MATLIPSTSIAQLEPFIQARVFGVSEIHTARAVIASVYSEPNDAAFLEHFALAIATWAPLNGHVCADISDLSAQVRTEMKSLDSVEEQIAFDSLQWPSTEELRTHLASSPLVYNDINTNTQIAIDYTKPLVLSGDLLYLTRQFIDEVNTAHAIGTRLTRPPSELPGHAEQWIADVFHDEHDGLQAEAVRNVLRYPTSVLLGGPGTGKTYTIAGMLHALFEKHASTAAAQPLRIALAAPTAKAAQQMTASITATISAVHTDGSFTFPQQHRESIADVCATSSTIHRLLGWLPSNRARFQHDQFTPLPYDVVVIDEVSMISLPLMARLLEALPPEATLVLVGDPAQLQSVEAGAVLPQISQLVSHATFPIVTLKKNRRQVSSGDKKLNHIGELAEMMRVAGDASTNEIDTAAANVLNYLQTPCDDITFVELPPLKNASSPQAPDPTAQNVRDAVAPHLAAFATAAHRARSGDATGALDALSTGRVLCAHREGKYGVSQWNALVADTVNVPRQRGSVGQPLLNTRNDIKSGLVNGDMSIVVQLGSARRAAFPPRATHGDTAEPTTSVRLFAPSALDDAEIAFAMTVHKAQGSQYDTVVVVVPPVGSPLLQRELLYTAVTRARKHLVIVATTESITTAMTTSIQRASGLARHIAASRSITS